MPESLHEVVAELLPCGWPRGTHPRSLVTGRPSRQSTLLDVRTAVEVRSGGCHDGPAVREATTNEKRRVREYVNAESPPEDGVTLVQKLSSRKILGRSIHLYDVRTEHHRWWVVSDPLMNLYSQEDFHEVDMVLAYHIGLCEIIADRSRKHWGEPEGILTGTWRRFQRAVDALADADEAEAFQGVGVMCREALLALIREEAKDVTPEQRPKGAAFKAWSKTLLASLSREQLRDYTTALADNTWDLVEWLQHYTGAAQADAALVLDATGYFISTYARVKLRQIDGRPERCPRCESYRLEDASHLADDGWVSLTACAACGWQSEPVANPPRQH